MSASSYVGAGRHGHLRIIMTNEEYFAIAADVFPLPDNPGASPEVVAGMTAAVITELTRLNREATQLYHTYHNVDQAIKKLIIDSYCWSHGYQVAKSHTSATCNVRKSGHQENATRVDTMGGVQWGK
jgi:hypothetical protein